MKKKLLSIAFITLSLSLSAQVVEKTGTYKAIPGTNSTNENRIVFSNLKMDNNGPKALIIQSMPVYYSAQSYGNRPINASLIDLNTQTVLKEIDIPYQQMYSDVSKCVSIVDYNGDGFDDIMITTGFGSYSLISLTNTVTMSTSPKSNIDFTQNYPNPFNEQTTIKYKLKNSDYVTIKIFDLSGKEITSMINQTMPAGDYTAQIDDAKLLSGTYFYQVQIGNEYGAKKMIKY